MEKERGIIITSQESNHSTVMVEKIDTTLYKKNEEEKKRLKALKKAHKASTT
jgi:hypothetical protein